MTTIRHDVVIVGARCAGAATAMLLAGRGHDVALVDRASFPSDTLSTHAISRAGVVQLDRWGLLPAVLASGAPPVRSVSFEGPGFEPTTRAIKTSAGVDLLLAPRRHVLDTIVRDAAINAGVTTYQGSVNYVTRDSAGRVDGVILNTRTGTQQIAARTVVGADGRWSRLAARFGAATRHWSTSPAAIAYCYATDLDATGFEFHLAHSALVGVFPTHDGEACVWMSAPTADLQSVFCAGADKREALRRLIGVTALGLGRRLATCGLSPVRGAAGLPNHLRQPYGPGWALVGDAGYHRDPITGHGITDAFRDAELLADALHTNLEGSADGTTALRGYDAARTLAIREIFAITRELTTFPGITRFADLQRRLSRAIEHEALTWAARPVPSRHGQPTGETRHRHPVLAA